MLDEVGTRIVAVVPVARGLLGLRLLDDRLLDVIGRLLLHHHRCRPNAGSVRSP